MHAFETFFFKLFSAVLNSFKYSQNACFRDIIIKNVLQFQIVSNSVRMNSLETLFSLFSAFPNLFKYCQNACLRDMVFKKFEKLF